MPARSHHTRSQTAPVSSCDGGNFGEKDEYGVNGGAALQRMARRPFSPSPLRAGGGGGGATRESFAFCTRPLPPGALQGEGEGAALGAARHVPLGLTRLVGIALLGSSGQGCRG